MDIKFTKEYSPTEFMEKARSVGNNFILFLPKSHEDTITTAGGLQLFSDPKWSEADKRAYSARMVSAPKELEDKIPRGCDIWFKHNMVAIKRDKVTDHMLKDGYYWLPYTDSYENNINNQAIAYRDTDGSIKTLGWFTLVKPYGSTDEDVKSSVIEVVSFKEKAMNLGRIFSISDNAKNMFGVDVGDIIYYKKNQRYRVEIDGETYYRIRPQGILGQWEE